MEALILKEYGKLELIDAKKPVPRADEVLIRIRATGICGSDVHGMDGSTGRRIPPLVMGHEAAGTIEEAGADARRYRAGDRVTFDSTIYCGECEYCRRGEINFCQSRRVLGVSCEEYRQAGTFARCICVPERILHRIPDAVSFDEGAMVEPLSIALHAINISPIKKGDTALVIGAGVIGLLTLQVLLARGCSRVYVADLDKNRLNEAKRLGAAEVFCSAEADLIKEVSTRTEGKGADCAFDAVGLEDTVQAGIQSLRKGGSLTLIGNFSPKIEIPLQHLISHQIRLQGSNASAGEYPECLALIEEGEVDVKSLISRTAPLSEGARLMDALYQGEAGLMKVILHP